MRMSLSAGALQCTSFSEVTLMGVDHGGGRGDKSPSIWSRGTLMHIVPSDFCYIGTKRSVLLPSKYAQIRFRPGLRLRPRWGAHHAPPDP